MERPAAIVLGHSFVHSCLHRLSNTSRSPPTPRSIARSFRLSHLLSDLHLHGVRGAYVTDTNFQLPASLIQSVHPTIAILDFGTNDIVGGLDPLLVAVTLYELAEKLIKDFGLLHVAICSIIPRHAGLRHMTPAQFSQQSHKVNHYIKTMCQGDPKISYHVHPGFWTTHYCTWSRDGIHPNTASGRQLYIRSLRKAIFKLLPKHHRT